MDAVRKLILDKLEEIGLKMSEASIRLGRNHAYLYQFLKKGIPLELKEKERARLAEIIGVTEDQLRGHSSPLPTKKYLKSSGTVAEASHVTKMSETGQNLIDSIRSVAQLYVDRDLPVHGTLQDARGVLLVTDSAVDWIARPTALARVQEAYGMIVTGDSMSPKIENGDTVLVNPHLPPRNGATCIFRRKTEDGSSLAVVRFLRHYSDDAWFVRQFNPRKDFTLKRSDWPACHVATDVHFAL